MPRARKPTARHKLEGTARPDRMNPREPRYSVEAPRKPSYIATRKRASDLWDAIVPLMLEQGTLSPAFATALEMYCLSYANAVEYELKARRTRHMDDHVTYRRLADNAQKEHRQWTAQLGLSPATSAKVSGGAPAKEETPLAKLQAKGAQLRRVK